MDEEEGIVIVERLPDAAAITADIMDRKSFIGGSDAPVILGLSPWKTRFELWQEKCGSREPDDLSEVERVQLGILLEDVVAQRAMVKYGWRLHRINERIVAKTLSYPCVAQIDRRLVGRDAIVEIKTTDASMGPEWGEEDTAEIPPAYYAQVQHQLLVSNKRQAWVVVLIGGNRIKRYSVPRDDEFISDLVEAETLFWVCVRDGIAPDPITADEAALRWSRAPANPVYGTRIHGALAAQYLSLAERIRDLERQQDQVKLELQTAMQDIGDTLYVEGTAVASWKVQTRDSIDTKALEVSEPEVAAKYRKASEYRVFRALKAAANFRMEETA